MHRHRCAELAGLGDEVVETASTCILESEKSFFRFRAAWLDHLSGDLEVVSTDNVGVVELHQNFGFFDHFWVESPFFFEDF